MSTWDEMTTHQREAMRDAGRNEGGGHERRGEPIERARPVEPPPYCPNGCGVRVRRAIRHRDGGYFVDDVCDACGQTVDVDDEGGV